MRPRIIFITGTDTGVGKTVLTALLLSHLRQTGHHAFALKPFCSGGRSDAKLLHSIQESDLTLDEINPFHFKEPLAPLVAARLHRRKVPLPSVLAHIDAVAEKLQFTSPVTRHPSPLLIEGAGGLLSPLGQSEFKVQSCTYSALDLIKALNCEVILVAPNRLGTINHTLLTLDKLQQAGVSNPILVLNDLLPQRSAGLDSRHNGALLSEIVKPVQMIPFPYIGKLSTAREIQDRAKKARNSLRKISKLMGL